MIKHLLVTSTMDTVVQSNNIVDADCCKILSNSRTSSLADVGEGRRLRGQLWLWGLRPLCRVHLPRFHILRSSHKSQKA